ncbi:MAG: DUF998 domain-containing protein [Roseovarius sp.]|uniref:DUF998 domain-containing protein n=1 Tax=Roseovarius sp. TaxID=1486281 RepID=UPI0032EE8A9B
MTTGNQHGTARQRPLLARALGVTGLLGCLAAIGGTLLAQAIVPQHDWVSETISDLAAGRHAVIMDVALYGFAAGIMATSLATARVHLGKLDWSAGAVALAVIAGLVIIVGARDEYGDGDSNGGAVVIHSYLVYALGLLFAYLPVGMYGGLNRAHPTAARTLAILGGGWVVLAPVFLLMSTGFDGVVERVLGLIACGMIAILSWVTMSRAPDAPEPRA